MAFDAATGMHTVLYEDGDRREYRMDEKEYTLEQADKASPDPGEGQGQGEVLAERPEARCSFNLSIYSFDMLEAFGRAGGFTKIMDRLEDSGRPLAVRIVQLFCCFLSYAASAKSLVSFCLLFSFFLTSRHTPSFQVEALVAFLNLVLCLRPKLNTPAGSRLADDMVKGDSSSHGALCRLSPQL